MKSTLGISMSSRQVHAVLVEATVIVWQFCAERGDGEEIPDVVSRVARSIPPQRRGPSRVCVAVGLGWSHVKQLDGLPPTSDMSVLSQALRENTTAFFLSRGSRLAVSDVSRRSDGSFWAAAFDHSIVQAAAVGLRACRYDDVQFLPSAVCVAAVVPRGAYEWREDEIVAEISVDDGGAVSRVVQRHQSVGVNEENAAAHEATIADAGWSYAAAYGAALAPRRAVFAWRAEPDPRRLRRMHRLRCAVAAVLLFTTAIAAAVAPGVRAELAIRALSRQQGLSQIAQRKILLVQSELRQTSEMLDHLQRFNGRRGEMTRLVGALSQALPESTALVSLHIDSLDATMVVLSPRAAEVLPELIGVPGVGMSRMVGSMTRESVGGLRLDRATVRFHRTPVTQR